MEKESVLVNVAISGSQGKMGRLIADLVNKHPYWRVCGGYDKYENFDGRFAVYSLSDQLRSEVNPKPNIFFDFSSEKATSRMFHLALDLHIPFLTGTTKLPDDLIAEMKSQTVIPVFQAYNMSTTVHKFIQDACYLAKQYEGYKIDIYDKHHLEKADAPSGTAWNLANAVKAALGNKHEILVDVSGNSEPNAIHVHTSRSGGHPGKHLIEFSTMSESIGFGHEAFSRQIFAEGAIKAAEFLLKQEPGYYNMDNM